MDIFKKSKIILSINLKLREKYGTSGKKVYVTLSPDQNKVQYHYRYNGEIKSNILNIFSFDKIVDMKPYCGLDPIDEIVIIMTDQIALNLPKNLFSNLKWITNRNIKWYPVSDYSSKEDKKELKQYGI